MTSARTPSATSSLEEDFGPSQPDLQDGPIVDFFGPVPAHASRSRRLAKGSEQMIQGICGRTFIASSVPSGPLSSWESRLRDRLGTVGSTESALIWRAKDTPAGQLISRLAPSTRHTNGTGSIGSPPMDVWPTMTALDRPRSDETLEKSSAFRLRNAGQKTTPLYLGEAMIRLSDTYPVPAQKAHWTTVSATDSVARENRYAQGGNPLTMQMSKAAYHPTPLSLSFKDSHQPGTNRTIEQMRAYMPTPTVADVQGGRKARSGNRSGEPLLNGICYEMEPTGQTLSGSPATMAKRGAPNPVFAFWLMGFPAEWISGALAAMQSYRKPRRK